jgi:hypothetical protein
MNHITPSGDLALLAVRSNKTYASSGKDSFIVGPAMYEPFVDVFKQICQIHEEKCYQEAEENTEFLEMYS